MRHRGLSADGIVGNFNPRTPYGMRRFFYGFHLFTVCISIHAPLTGCDAEETRAYLETYKFQSTHPLRDATKEKSPLDGLTAISIHAPLTGCDVKR